MAPAIALAILTFLLGGWPVLVVGFFWSTVAVYHATFCINSLAHVHGRTRYVTGDNSRNNWALAFFTMGEGWHNNHHAYQSSVRQGFKWWEIDPTYYVLKGLSGLRVVWDLKVPPAAVLQNQQRLGRKVIEKAAADLAATFNTESICTALRQALAGTPNLADLRERLGGAHHRAADILAGMHLPHLPDSRGGPDAGVDDVLQRLPPSTISSGSPIGSFWTQSEHVSRSAREPTAAFAFAFQSAPPRQASVSVQA